MNAPRRIESSNLMVGAAVSMFEVTTLGQPLEGGVPTFGASKKERVFSPPADYRRQSHTCTTWKQCQALFEKSCCSCPLNT
ncbi:uncharacterized protein VP01_10671g1, partial [Puccinia sorghi]